MIMQSQEVMREDIYPKSNWDHTNWSIETRHDRSTLSGYKSSDNFQNI